MSRFRSVVEAAFAISLLILLAPMLAITALSVALTIPGAPVVRRHLPSAAGVPIPCHRFRTSPDGQPEKRIGRFLRETSIEVLPALLNVARGDMRLADLLRRVSN